ncbi:tocopherol cyclase family protein [Enterococcus faecium]|uniref:tocopherol cyclase family protein n=1 Tax=Enterococcus faecium TaxID=1352 RepID=UPI000BF1E932|nr:tocopherol cyclase family protein [Enterococcus faecium]PEH49683.1 hypothetical protein CRM75_00575 [Enterococcus faecium]
MVILTDLFYQGEKKKFPFFEGWYFKQQIGQDVYSFIPGYSIDESGKKQPFIQIITHEYSEIFMFESDELYINKDHLSIQIGENQFSEKGIKLALISNKLTLTGTLTYGAFIPLKRTHYVPSVMGPFSYFSFMECYHSILSMEHTVSGEISWNGRIIDFANGSGYLEKDWGNSFPKSYLWIQCNQFPATGARFFFSAADIPFLSLEFLGLIIVLQIAEKEYRLATYYGAKIIDIFHEEEYLVITIRQKELQLQIKVLQSEGHPLMAPQQGIMERVIREKASTEILLTLKKNQVTIFQEKGNAAGFEEVGNIRGYAY